MEDPTPAPAPSESDGEAPALIPVRYPRAQDYRIYHVDGAFGAFTPNGNVTLDFFVERGTFPDLVVYENNNGSLGKEHSRRQDSATIVRERVCGMFLDLSAAIRLRDWLNDKVNDAMELGFIIPADSQESDGDDVED